MKGSLQELVVESAETHALAQERMSCHAQQIAELEAAGVSKRRINILYPFDAQDYEQGIARVLPKLLIQWANGTNTLMPELKRVRPRENLHPPT